MRNQPYGVVQHLGSATRVARSLGADDETEDVVQEAVCAEDPALLAARAEQCELLRAAMLRPGEQDRVVLRCRYLMELSEAETAEVLGWATGSVKSRTSRALRRLHTILAPQL